MTQTEFLKIAECKTAMKGSFKATIIKVGDLKAGSKDGRDWTKKTFTLEDDTDNVELVAWGDETSKFKLGYVYEIVNPWWKTYEGKITVQVGKYGSAKVIGSDNAESQKPAGQETLVNKEDTQSVPSQHISTFNNKVTEQNPEPKDLDKITDQKVIEETILLKKIHNTVQKTIGESWQKDAVNLFTQLIYQKYFGDKN